MKALVQRVAAAWVSVGREAVGEVGQGMVVLLGVARGDSREDARYLAQKITNMRIFADGESEFALSALEVGAGILVVSQFTLLADVRKGRRPGFSEAAPPDEARRLYEFFVDQLRSTGLKVKTGVFQEHMMVRIDNDGPVTLLVESRERQKTN